MEMKEILNYLFAHNTLSQDESRKTLSRLAQGEFSEAEMASFLTVYLMRRITPHELAGFRSAMLDLSIPVDLREFETIDVCGTGGDEKNTFNISTLSSFVIAGAGAKVVKHGNYGVSSVCGSSNILEHFGYQFSNNQEKLKKEVELAGICYLHAPFFHPAMKNIGPVRRSLKVKTFFNILGPLINPARPTFQITGVYNREVQDIYYEVFKSMKMNFCIIYSLDGYDEISLTGDFRAVTEKEDKIYSPEMLQLQKVKPEELFGGDSIPEAADQFMKILEGKGTKAQNQAVIVNSAFALQTMDRSMSLSDCLEKAQESLIGKKAFEVFKKLIDIQ